MLPASPERQTQVEAPHSRDVVPTIDSRGSKRELVRRILRSSSFARSERLATLLAYVCDLTLNGREAEINEQLIGQAVFGRPPDYDSSADGIVRSQASRLRQRLELYFQQEGADESMRVFIPRGAYVPIFTTKTPVVQPVVKPLSEGESTSSDTLPASIDMARDVKALWGMVPWILSLVLSAVVIVLLIYKVDYHHSISVPELHPFWGRLLKKNEPVMVVVPDSGLVLYHAFSGKSIDLKDYLDGRYRSDAGRNAILLGPQATDQDRLSDLSNRRYTSLVDVNAIMSLRDKAQTFGTTLTVRYARDLRPNDLKSGNVVILGAYTANPWVELFEPKLAFILRDDYTSTFSVVNRNPTKDEPGSWVSSRNDPQRHAFGIIAFMQNLRGDGDALLLQGIGMSGTEAAMDFVNNDGQFRPFLSKIQRPDGTIPHFELVLETRTMDASAVQSRILAWRVVN